MGPSFDEKTSAQVLRQVEFYFSDSNLPGDKFLRKCLEESEDGLISLPLVCSFSRMRNHLGLKEAGPDKVPAETTLAVAEVLRKSSSLRVSDDGQKVGRINTLGKVEEVQAAVDARSVAAGPLCWNVTMEAIESFFSQHAKVNSVRLPRHPVGRIFCGFAVVELASEDEVKRVLDLKLMYDGAELEIKSKNEFDEEMEKYQQQQENAPYGKVQHPKQAFNDRRHGNGRNDAVEASYPKGLIVAFSLQKVSTDEDVVVKNKESAGVDSKEGDACDSKEKVDASDSKEKSEASDSKEKDNASDLKDKGDASDLKEKSTTASISVEVETNQITREDIKNVLNKFGRVKYVDYSRGGTSGYVRFETPEGAQKARTAAVLAEEGGLSIRDHIATLEAVEGEAEKEYWAKVRGAQDKMRGEFGRGSRNRFQRDYNSRPGRKPSQKQEDNESKVQSDTKLGKHMRFEADEVGEDVEPPSKQSKAEDE